MELLLVREEYYDNCTKGKLYVDGKFFDTTLEDTDRGLTNTMNLEEIKTKKVYAMTAIPKGRYKVIADYSNKFKKVMTHICDVPGWLGVRIHGGTNTSHTLGCPLIHKANTDVLTNMVLNAKECYITIE